MTHTQPIPSTMRALVAPSAGAPLELRELPVPRPRHGEVLVRMAAAPLNPSDLLMLRGEYGRGWTFPFVPGVATSPWGVRVKSRPSSASRASSCLPTVG
jgi:hypothetical protein